MAATISAEVRTSIDAAIAELKDGEKDWAAASVADRALLLRRVHESVSAEAENWAETASRMKGIPRGSQLEGEEWLSGPYGVLDALSLLADSLDRLADGGSPLDGEHLGRAVGGRVTVRALPRRLDQSILLNGHTVDVWLKPDVTKSDAKAAAGLWSRDPSRTGGIGLVLGAGNITSIPALDVLYELIANNRVVLLKLNKVMDAMLPVFESAFAPLIRADVLKVIAGRSDDGSDPGPYLTAHDGIAHVHITGSGVSHDAIVFGPGAEGLDRKARGETLLGKPITSELGGVSPIIVVPGEWTPDDLRYQAQHVATQRLHNGGYNCIAGQTVVLSTDWPQRESFLAELRLAMTNAPERPAWYPGSDDRVAGAIESYPGAETFDDGTRVMVTVRPGRTPSEIESTEYFAPVLGVIELPGLGRDFLDAAVGRVNREFVGTLGANIIIDPSTRRKLGRVFENAIAQLRYGTVAVNAWTAVGFLTAAAPWGAFPGNTLDDVGSGIGVVHNALLLADTEKTVVRGPFRPFPRSIGGGELSLFPTPPWFVTARSAATTGRRMVAYSIQPSIGKLVRVLASAFRA